MSKKRSRSNPKRRDGKARPQRPQHAKSKAAGPPKGPATRGPLVTPSAMREIVESVVIAFVLAFLFRTFEAEAFVIPTGSMAPTLMGRHKDVICEACGFPFQVSASDEIDSETNRPTGARVVSGTCPNCRHTMYMGPDPRSKRHPSYKGDRILVAKFPYRFADPKRWDVAVFKFPGRARTNFIKRVVGLAGETIRIEYGDLYVKNGDRDGWHIARKPLEKARAMMRLVYDNDYVQPQIVSGVWPARWSDQHGGTAGEWVPSKDYKAYRTDGSSDSEVWLGYRHLLPSYDDWQALAAGIRSSSNSIRPQLITDFTSYNTEVTRPVYGRDDMHDVPPPKGEMLGLHWVGDLAVQCAAEVQSNAGEALFELVEGGRRFDCRIDVATGKATLGIDGDDDFQPTAQTGVRGPGEYRVFFANFDDKLFLSIGGWPVTFDAPTTFGPLDNTRPTTLDLEPIRIGSAGAAVEVRHLKVFRDNYYIAERMGKSPPSMPSMTDYKRRPFPYPFPGPSRRDVARILSSPHQWAALASSRGTVQFTLGEGQFLVLGDNSAESKDSRLWEHDRIEYYVSRELLIGKALVIYWPHSLDRVPGTNIPIRFFPNFWRMEAVR